MAEKKALITGACGFSAPWVIRELLKHDWNVIGTDLKIASRDCLREFEGNNNFTFIPADLTQIDTLKPLFKDIEVIYHPAALFSYSADMDLLRKINVEGTKNLLDLSINHDVKKMVMWSSIAAYGSADPKFYDMPIKELPVEMLNPKIEGNYDRSKREQELAARTYWEENRFPITFMRLAPLYGPGSYYGMYALFRYIYEDILQVAPSNLGKGKGNIPIVHAEDVARCALHLSDPKKYNGDAYNVADDYTMDLIETISFIANLVGSKFRPIIPMPMKLVYLLLKIVGMWSTWEAKNLRSKVNGKPPLPLLESDLLVYLKGNFYFDNSKLKETGFEFKYPDRRHGLIELVDWYNNNGWYPSKPQALKGSEQGGLRPGPGQWNDHPDR